MNDRTASMHGRGYGVQFVVCSERCRAETRLMPRRICFVTGTRAEFGLMARTLGAIQARADLALQIVATGMHLSDAHGRTVDELRRDGWRVDRVVDWRVLASPAAATGAAMAGLAGAFAGLDPDIVLVVGDRVEAFAAAAAAHLDGRVVAHVHGGDRAQGQADDALRHAVTKLAHLHFAATPASAARLARLGEDAWRIHAVGAPGIDGIIELAAPSDVVAGEFGVEPNRFALLVYHPTRPDAAAERATAAALLDATLAAGVDRVVIIYPNNDPGHEGIVRCPHIMKSDVKFLMEGRRALCPGSAFVVQENIGGHDRGRTSRR